MRQHRAGDDIADGVDAGDIGAEMRIDDHAAAVILFHTGRFEAETIGEGHTADRHQHDVRFDGLGGATSGGLNFHVQRLCGGVDAGNFG